MTKEDDQIESVKDDRRVDKTVAIQFSKKSHVCDASLLHPVLIQL